MDLQHCLMDFEEFDPWALLDNDLVRKAIRLRDYMLGEGRMNPDPNVTLVEMSNQLTGAGIPLDRCATIVRILHSINAASMRVWEAGKGATYNSIPYRSRNDAQYLRSPSAFAHQTGCWVRFNPNKIPADAFGIVPDLIESKTTDYICAPTFMVNGLQNVFTFATCSKAGFSDRDIAFLRATFPAIEACQEILVTHRILKEVTRTYVGEEPHQRILAGDVHRGEVTHLKSAILFADMREFTQITSTLSAEEATALLNEYYDCVVPAIEGNGGEVLKFIGDGILAIFRSGDDEQVACTKALQAAREGLLAVAERNKIGQPEFKVGISLHFGEVAYGNVGSGERLDYTVIGKDVNLASRIADMCGKLNEQLLVSGMFLHMTDDENARSCGEHELKGVPDRTQLYAFEVGSVSSNTMAKV